MIDQSGTGEKLNTNNQNQRLISLPNGENITIGINPSQAGYKEIIGFFSPSSKNADSSTVRVDSFRLRLDQGTSNALETTERIISDLSNLGVQPSEIFQIFRDLQSNNQSQTR